MSGRQWLLCYLGTAMLATAGWLVTKDPGVAVVFVLIAIGLFREALPRTPSKSKTRRRGTRR